MIGPSRRVIQSVVPATNFVCFESSERLLHQLINTCHGENRKRCVYRMNVYVMDFVRWSVSVQVIHFAHGLHIQYGDALLNHPCGSESPRFWSVAFSSFPFPRLPCFASFSHSPFSRPEGLFQLTTCADWLRAKRCFAPPSALASYPGSMTSSCSSLSAAPSSTTW